MSKTVGQFNVPLPIHRGETEVATFVLASSGTPVNITGYTAKLQIRATADSPDAFVTLASSDSPATIANGGSNGTFTVTFSATATAAYTWTSGVWDFQVTNGAGAIAYWCGGSAECHHTVTR